MHCSVCGKDKERSEQICPECLAVAKDLSGKPLPQHPVAVIPARYGSSRFPGKPLALLAGKPMIQHVYQRCLESQAFSQVLVATDDPRIAEAVQTFGGRAELTSPGCESGTDRVAEVARALEKWLPAGSDERMAFVNVQGDEPAIHPRALAELAQAFQQPEVEMATLVRPLDEAERQDPNVVKALVGVDGHALYFTRADAPYLRNPSPELKRYAHLGVYGYRWHTLLTLAALPPSPLEQAEGLEQLRALEHGIRIACRVTEHRSVGVDRPEDLASAERLLQSLPTG